MNRGCTLSAYEILFRDGVANHALLGDADHATAQVLTRTLGEFGMDSLSRLLVLLNGDPSMQELEDALKLNPDILIHIFRLANSAGSGVRRRVETVRDAISLIGTAQIARWVQLPVYVQGDERAVSLNPLVQLVGTRARFMELVAAEIEAKHPVEDDFTSKACLVGMLSLMHLMFQTSCSDLMDQLLIDGADAHST